MTLLEETAPGPARIVLGDDFFLDQPRSEDAAVHRRFAEDPEAARFFGWTVAQARSASNSHYENVVRRFIRDWENGTRFAFAIRRLSDDEPIGMVELQIRPPAREATVSYLVMPDLRGRGIAPRALEAALGWVAREHGLRTATVQCHVDNLPSRRAAEKCGFVLSGRSGVELSFRRDLNAPDEIAK